MGERYFDDFSPGDTFTTASHTVTEEEIVGFARQYDAQPYHLDPEAGRGSVFGSLVAGGFQSAALIWALVVRQGIFRACSLAGLGVDRLRWHKPMRPGDTLYVRGTVKSARHMTSRPDRGVLTTRYELINHNDEVILVMDLTTMLARRPGAAENGRHGEAQQPRNAPSTGSSAES